MGAAKDERKTVTVRLGEKELEFCKKVRQELNMTITELMLEAIRIFLWIARTIKNGGQLVLIDENEKEAHIVVPSLEWLKEKDLPKKGGQDGG